MKDLHGVLNSVLTSAHSRLDALRLFAELFIEARRPANLSSAVSILELEFGDSYGQLSNNDGALLRNLCLLKIHGDLALTLEPGSKLNRFSDTGVLLAEDAFYLPKHALQSAAKILRQKIGGGREEGAGRRKKDSVCSTSGGMEKFRLEFEDNLPYIMADEEFMDRLCGLVAMYKSMGNR